MPNKKVGIHFWCVFNILLDTVILKGIMASNHSFLMSQSLGAEPRPMFSEPSVRRSGSSITPLIPLGQYGVRALQTLCLTVVSNREDNINSITDSITRSGLILVGKTNAATRETEEPVALVSESRHSWTLLRRYDQYFFLNGCFLYPKELSSTFLPTCIHVQRIFKAHVKNCGGLLLGCLSLVQSSSYVLLATHRPLHLPTQSQPPSPEYVQLSSPHSHIF